MATIKQLLAVQGKIDSTNTKLDQLRDKRKEIIKALNLETPRFSEPRKENFINIDGAPVRLWVNAWGEIEVEHLKF